MQSDITRFHAILNQVAGEKDEAMRSAVKWAVDQSLVALRQQDDIERLRAELAAMRKQRDEARREVCEADAILGTTAADTANAVARLRGWDCFGQGGGA